MRTGCVDGQGKRSPGRPFSPAFPVFFPSTGTRTQRNLQTATESAWKCRAQVMSKDATPAPSESRNGEGGLNWVVLEKSPLPLPPPQPPTASLLLLLRAAASQLALAR